MNFARPIHMGLFYWARIMELTIIFVLMLIYQVKHYVCDYKLQNTYMLGKMCRDGWELPLAAHCAVHAVGTFVIAIFCTGSIGFSICMALFDFATHFVVDKIKVEASRELDPKTSAEFWLNLGLDQMAHHVVHIVIVWMIIGYNIA